MRGTQRKGWREEGRVRKGEKARLLAGSSWIDRCWVRGSWLECSAVLTSRIGVAILAYQQAALLVFKSFPKAVIGVHARPHCFQLSEGDEQWYSLRAHQMNQNGCGGARNSRHAVYINCASTPAPGDKVVDLVKVPCYGVGGRVMCTDDEVRKGAAVHISAFVLESRHTQDVRHTLPQVQSQRFSAFTM